jgi:hypothetical protein
MMTARVPMSITAGSAADELDRLYAGRVRPLQVVDQEQHRRPRGRVGYQLQHGQRDEEPLGRIAVSGHAERARDGAPVARREGIQPGQQRAQQLVQRPVRQVTLRLGAPGGQPGQAALPSRVGRPLQQRGLADPGLAVDDQATTPVSYVLHQVVQYVQFGIPADNRGITCRSARLSHSPPLPVIDSPDSVADVVGG